MSQHYFAKQVSLTLEEKQRLAEQQEQQKLYKSQPKLASPTSPSSTTSSSSMLQPKPASAPSKPQVKDLTSTLMNSNLNSMSASQKPVSSSSSAGAFGSSGFSSVNSSSLAFSGASSGSFGQNSSSMSAMNTGFGMSSTTATKPQGQGSMDMSALDSLLPSKAKPSMNQMQQNSQAMNMGMQQGMMVGGNFGMQQQGMMGGPRMMGNTGMMGMQQRPMGMQPVGQQNMFSQQPMMNNSQTTKNDFDTLFG